MAQRRAARGLGYHSYSRGASNQAIIHTYQLLSLQQSITQGFAGGHRYRLKDSGYTEANPGHVKGGGGGDDILLFVLSAHISDSATNTTCLICTHCQSLKRASKGSNELWKNISNVALKLALVPTFPITELPSPSSTTWGLPNWNPLFPSTFKMNKNSSRYISRRWNSLAFHYFLYFQLANSF